MNESNEGLEQNENTEHEQVEPETEAAVLTADSPASSVSHAAP
jgi:hypothetical protein